MDLDLEQVLLGLILEEEVEVDPDRSHYSSVQVEMEEREHQASSR
jgi:hypothetical protein